MLILMDSGVLLRVMERADPLHGTVRHALRTLNSRGDEFVISLQNVAEFWNVCTRPATSRGGLGLSVGETDRRLRVLERIVQARADHPDTYRQCRQLVVTHGVQGRQVHDCRLVAFMQTHGITHILTLNGGDFARYPGITVLDPTTIPAPAPPALPAAPSPPGPTPTS